MSKNFLLTLLSVLVLVSSSRAETLRGAAPQRNLGDSDEFLGSKIARWWTNTYVDTVDAIESFLSPDDEPELPGFSDEPSGFTEPAAATAAPTDVVTTATTFDSSFAGTSDE